MNAFLVHDVPLSSQDGVDAEIPISRPTGCDLLDAEAQLAVIARMGSISEGRSVKAHQPAQAAN
jgi:hypothetical protein